MKNPSNLCGRYIVEVVMHIVMPQCHSADRCVKILGQKCRRLLKFSGKYFRKLLGSQNKCDNLRRHKLK